MSLISCFPYSLYREITRYSEECRVVKGKQTCSWNLSIFVFNGSQNCYNKYGWPPHWDSLFCKKGNTGRFIKTSWYLNKLVLGRSLTVLSFLLRLGFPTCCHLVVWTGTQIYNVELKKFCDSWTVSNSVLNEDSKMGSAIAVPMAS